LAIGALLLAFLVVAAIHFAGDEAARILANPEGVPDSSVDGVRPLTKSQMLRLCQLCLRSDRWPQSRHYVGQRIIQSGKSVALKPLLEIVRDDTLEPAVRLTALKLLFNFQDEQVLYACMEFVEWVPWAASVFVGVLPVGFDSPYCDPTSGLQALKKDMEGISYEDFVLRLLDQRVHDSDLYGNDLGVLRWLNRYDGYDFDELLELDAPGAIDFRNAGLRKGYDPLTSYSSLFCRVALAQDEVDGGYSGELIVESRRFLARLFKGTGSPDERGLEKLFPRESDREACRALFRVYFGRTFIYGQPSESGWRERLTEWYKEARPHLTYDPEMGRFVVSERSADEQENAHSRAEEAADSTASAVP
jgi:hypothetical protein